MDAISILLVLALLFVILLVLGLPVAFALFLSSLLAALFSGIGPLIIVQQFIVPFTNESLLAIFTFVALGVFMDKIGVAKDLIDFFDDLVGHFHGGLGVTSVITSTFYGTLTGSVTSTVAGIGAITIPEMRKKGYSSSFSTGIIATAGILGSLIPPSIVGIIYGVTTNISIIGVFMATVGPAIIYTILLSFMIILISRRRGYRGREKRVNLSAISKHFLRVFPALMIPLSVLGSIYLGISSPTEAGVVGTVAVLVLGLTYYKSIDLSTLRSAILETSIVTSIVMFLIASSYTLSYILTFTGILKQFTGFLLSVSPNIIIMLLLINMLLLFLGCIMDATPIIILLAPTISITLAQLGMHPLHIAAIFLFNVLVGLITPPVGTALFTACAISGDRVEKVAKDMLPLFICALLTLLLTTYIPKISLYIPQVLGLI